MAPKPASPTWQQSLALRWRVWRARPMRGATALLSYPEPRKIGAFSRGRQLMAGNFLFDGLLVEQPGAGPWDLSPPSQGFAEDLHGFGWLDDLMAVGDTQANGLAQAWVLAWIKGFGRGKGPGWVPDLLGRRMIRWISHAPSLLSGMGRKDQRDFFDALSRQAVFLSREWAQAAPGLPRIEALTGLIYCSLTLEGLERLRGPAMDALATAAQDDITEDGGLATRNPEDLLEAFTLLGWSVTALDGAGEDVSPALTGAQERIAPTLRALRHADGGLARFHGGTRGRPGRLDQALVTSGIRTPATTGQAMGFATLAHGRTTIVVDAAVPPKGPASARAHASTLAFELTSGAHPVIVNCGPGKGFGPDWERAGRATASHSTLSLEKYSSARIGPLTQHGTRQIAPLVQGPKRVLQQKTGSRKVTTLVLSHDGYQPSHGLSHLRRIVLSTDGREVQGEDNLRCLNRADKARFDDRMTDAALQGVAYHIRFHLHPEVEAAMDMGGRAVSLSLPNGEVWVFRAGRGMEMALDPSVYLDPTRLKPRATKQIVLSDRLMKYAATVDWTLTKAQEATELSPSLTDRARKD